MAVLDHASKLIQVLSVVVGVVISVLSFNATREKEVDVRKKELQARKDERDQYEGQQAVEAEKRQTEAARPFLELRQKLYLEAVQAAGVLANPGHHSPEDVKKAKVRFGELYVAELSMVEDLGVEGSMKQLATAVDPSLVELTKEQVAAYNLAHALRDSLARSWKMGKKVGGNLD